MNLAADQDFDPDALRDKYRQERDRRLRPEANGQYREVAGAFAHYVEDPYVTPGFTRAPIVDEAEVVVIGGGFGGLIAAARLKQAGISDIRIVEQGGDFGGTWYWNRYPGAQCDIESYIYLPLLEETGYIPTEKYVFGPEIRAHARRIGETFDLYGAAMFQTRITEIRWIEDEMRWLVATSRDDRIRARYVIMSNGPLNRPKLPGVPGIERFKGHGFHTSRWDYDYTGGDARGNLDRLGDKRVAVIGTGATAIQCVPHLAAAARRLIVFQRTPSSVDARGNRPTDPRWAESLTPGWQKRRMDNFNILVTGGAQEEDLVSDGWTDIIRNLGALMQRNPGAATSLEEVGRIMELADFKKMNEIRARVDATVRDPTTAEALKPWYRQFCKRPTFSDDYLPTFNRPNVTLVDTEGRGVDEITEHSVVVGGDHHEVDCIVFATGFEVGTAYTRRAGFEVYGRDGLPLSDYWAAGLKTLHGFYSAGFPNCFHMGVTQNAVTANFPHMLDEQANHITDLILSAAERQSRVLEPTPEGEQAWVATVRAKAGANLQFRLDCTPGYYNGEGKPGQGGLLDELYGPGPTEFYSLVRAWRAEGRFEGLRMA